ncbi:hypothetical protein QBA35_37690 [Streptomyces bottropensis]|uniref:Uncharacterized protein n=1 Tax=Streptomyces bottropensis TaxID=42235 RepID=A0ABU8AZX9_9ACTN
MVETVKESAAAIRKTIAASVMPALAAWRFSSSGEPVHPFLEGDLTRRRHEANRRF